MNNRTLKDTLQIGFALFAIFFGAGNLIFPPYLGWQSGDNWFVGFLCFLFVDIGMGLFIICAIAKIGEGSEGIVNPLGRKCTFIFLSAICLCIGPCIAIPRTASLTYDIGVVPAFGEVNSWIVTFVFFAIAFVSSIRKSKVVSLIGNGMAPIMLVALLFMIAVSIINPIGDIAPSYSMETVIQDSLLAGYQTMDMLAAVIFAIAMLNAIKEKGYQRLSQQSFMLKWGGLFATFLLFMVYGGLAYIGATASVNVTEEMSQSRLLVALVYTLMGDMGLNLLSVIVSFACLTTAIGLLTSISEYFEEHLHISYEILVMIFTIVSWILSNLGTTAIISLAVPILNLLYPILIILTFYAFIREIVYFYEPCQFAVFGAFTVSLIQEIEKVITMDLISSCLPLNGIGFAWLIPSLVMFVIGIIYCRIRS